MRSEAESKYNNFEIEYKNKLSQFPSVAEGDDEKLKYSIDTAVEFSNYDINYYKQKDLSNELIKQEYEKSLKRLEIAKKIKEDYENGKISAKEGIEKMAEIKKYQ